MSRFRTIVLFVALAAVWGSSYIAISVGLESLPPVLFAAIRYDVAGALLFAYALVGDHALRPTRRRDWAVVAVGGVLLIGLHFAFLFVGQQYVTSAIAAIVLSLTPVVTPVFALLLLPDERLDLPGALGVLFGLAGVVVIARPSPAALDGTLVGVGLLVLSALSFALGAVVTLRMRTTLSLVPMQAWMMAVGAAVLHVLSLLLPGESLAAAQWNAPTIAAVAYLAAFASAGGYLAYFELLEELGPIEVSLVNYATPAFAAVGGLVVLGEPIDGRTVQGFLVILAGFLLLKWETLYRELSAVVGDAERPASSSSTVSVGGNVYHVDSR